MKSIFFVVTILILTSCVAKLKSPIDQTKPKNIILLIGDGMGPATIKALRMFQDDPCTPQEERLVFDDYLLGSLNTNSADLEENITDSAASATAYATGRKTINGALSIDPQNRHFPTVLEAAKKNGMSTGVVVTSSVTHATPAAFASHQIDRDQEKDIASQYFYNQLNDMPMIDVILGGGRQYFSGPGQDLVTAFEGRGYEYLETRQALLASTKPRLLGLFDDDGLDKMWDRDSKTPSLREMTQVALDKLTENPNGFFLLIEGSQIDWAAHANDIVGVISEMQDFEAAFSLVVEFAQKDKNTLVIATADHSTGGLAIGSKTSGDDVYIWNTDVIKSFKYTPEKIAKNAQKSGDLVAEFNKGSEFVLTEKEIEYLDKANLKDWEATRKIVSKVVSNRSHTGWTTYGHTGEDVYLYGLGPRAEKLRGHWDNTKIGLFLFEMFGD